jgi:uncharacterized protein YraI
MGIILSLVAALTGTSLLAQTSAPAPAAATGQTANIVAQNVNVRSGPGQAYYSCLVISSPATVQVVGETSGWLKIVPPQGAFSLVSKKYVKAEGSTGAITGTNVMVRAGSDLAPNRMDQMQTRLNVGDKVTVLGELGDYYKIAPPPGAYLYVSAEFVKGAGGTELAAAPTSMPAVAAAVGRKVTDVTTPVTPRPVRKATPMPSVAVMSEERTAFDAAEKALNDEYKKPREQRNLKGLLEQYKSIKPAAGSPYQPYVDARISFLANEVELANDLATAETNLSELESQRGTMAAARAKIKADIPDMPINPVYTVEGELQASGLYSGGATGPKRYTIGAKPLIKAYVQCSSGAIDLDKYVGQYVGVSGKPKYDEKSGMYLIDAEQVVIMKPGLAPGSSVPSNTPPPSIDTPIKPAEKKPAEKPAAADKPASAKPAADKPAAPAPDAVVAPVAEPTSQPKAPVSPEDFQ